MVPDASSPTIGARRSYNFNGGWLRRRGYKCASSTEKLDRHSNRHFHSGDYTTASNASGRGLQIPAIQLTLVVN
jgi:hypothetical protein